MKSTVKVFAMMALLAVIVVGCGKAEKILPKGTGMWAGKSSHTVTSVNDSVTSDITDTDSLGSTYFDKDGTGYTVEFGSTTHSDFTWTVNDDNSVITITGTDSGSVAMPIDIVDISAKEMTLHFLTTIDMGPLGTMKIENTSVSEKVK